MCSNPYQDVIDWLRSPDGELWSEQRIMFPVEAKCVTFNAGYKMEQVRARKHLELGKIYTIRTMTVGQSSSHLTFYDIPGEWNTVFFDAYFDPEYDELSFEEACEEAGWHEPLGGNDEEAQ